MVFPVAYIQPCLGEGVPFRYVVVPHLVVAAFPTFKKAVGDGRGYPHGYDLAFHWLILPFNDQKYSCNSCWLIGS